MYELLHEHHVGLLLRQRGLLILELLVLLLGKAIGILLSLKHFQDGVIQVDEEVV